MNAVRLQDFGGPEVLKIEDLPIPEPKDDEILVRVHAASVNPVDYKIRQGKYPPVKREALPIVLGRDFSGTIEACGTRVQSLKKADTVFALLGRGRGSYAQYVVAKAVEFTAKPANLDHVHAAAVPLAAITAWQGLFDHGGLKANQRVLIHGGAGGVGHFAVQFAKAKGAWVAATCAGDDVAFVRSLGADMPIDYKSQRFEEKVSELDLVFDLVAGETQERSFAVLKKGGTLVSTLQKPDEAKAKQKNVRGAHYMAEANAAQLREIAQLIEAGKVKPVVSKTFPLEEVGKAQEYLEKEHPRAKVVLEVA